MKKSVILVTGCDANFYGFMEEALKSLAAIHIDTKVEIGILDLGLLPDQVGKLQMLGCIVRAPGWDIDIPDEMKNEKQKGLVARTALREYFPGFEVYIWFDADAWAQTPDFFDLLTVGARTQHAAIIRENGPGYGRDFTYNRWWAGHMVMTYGPITGIKQSLKPAVNIGIMALSDTAPHWDAWKRHYKRFIEKRKKLNMDQHAFNGALELENLPCALIPARCNWICTLSPPRWDNERKLFCEPDRAHSPLSILHLAGPDKKRPYKIQQTSGGEIQTPLTYAAFMGLA